jgi:hypothetical protein
VVRGLLFAVPFNAFLHLLVNLAQRHTSGAFQFVRIGVVCHDHGLVRMSRLDLDTDG